MGTGVPKEDGGGAVLSVGKNRSTGGKVVIPDVKTDTLEIKLTHKSEGGGKDTTRVEGKWRAGMKKQRSEQRQYSSLKK
jgi:hypothetical protein